jgi:pyrroline-5-carboxylate reductase
MRIGIIGGGFMGEAFLRGLLRAEVASRSSIAVAEINEARRTVLAEHDVRVTDDPESACIGADVVLLAVKPQDLPAVAESLRGHIPAEAVVVSIAAGVPLADVQRYTEHPATARVLPNLAAAIGEGAATVLLPNSLTPRQRDHIDVLTRAVSTAVIEVDDDAAIDLATAVQGSGPGFVYLVIESMIDSAVRLGMKRPDATELVLATVAGAARYGMEIGLHPAELRNAVTSPGGTTAAGLAELEAAGLRAAFDDAIEAAYLRAEELG